MILKNISVDCVIFGFDGEKLKVLLWQAEPEILENFLTTKEEYEEIKFLFEKNPALNESNDFWGLIGTHLPIEEDLDAYAKKILQITTGLDEVFLTQVRTMGATKRVPHYRVLTIAYYALINPAYHDLKLSPLAKSVKWFEIDQLPKLLFDHADIIRMALDTLREQVKYHPVGFHLLPDKFTLTELQSLYEVVLGTKLDTRNFRKKILKMSLLVDTMEKQTNVAHRAAKLYSFDLNIYKQLTKEGLNFSI
ncbi:MAG TPA: NUDIX hydrolase [Draconibacterium sp.]|nr:NUDIX hydrolase [Draconibacterium sp.]